MSGVGKKDMGIVKQESCIGKKNWILKFTKWLKDNGYFEEAKECAWHANYNPFEDVRELDGEERNEME